MRSAQASYQFTNVAKLGGDYGTLNNNHEPLLAKAFCDAVVPVRSVTYRHSSQFHVIYVNNLTEAMVSRFDNGLRPFVGYVGMADMSYGSRSSPCSQQCWQTHF